MGIILVSSVPIKFYRDDELSPIEDDVVVEGQEPAPVYYGPVRRYEPRPVVYRHGKKCFLRVVPNREKEEI